MEALVTIVIQQDDNGDVELKMFSNPALKTSEEVEQPAAVIAGFTGLVAIKEYLEESGGSVTDAKLS